MKSKIRIIAPVVIFGGLLFAAFILMSNRPQPGQRPPARDAVMTVAIEKIAPRDYQVILDSYGAVQPRTQSQLVAQVTGQVEWISPSLRDGGYFDAGEPLLRLDRRDYDADLKIAEAQLIDAQRGLVEAEAQREQAQKDWDKLGRADQPTDLVLKIPQLLAAQARLKSTESSLEKAKLAYERTEVIAPFAGRVLDQRVDLGQVVAPNTILADIYATDAIEVRLPLRNRDLAFIELPEATKGRNNATGFSGAVVLESTLGINAEWIGDLVRTESAIDGNAQQLHVIARIDDPFGANLQHERPLKIGEYVTARLAGRLLQAAIVVPNSAIYQGSYVYRVEDGLLQRTDIEIVWQNESDAIIGTGLAPGDQLVLTALGQVTSGMSVAIEGEARPREGRPSPFERNDGAISNQPDKAPEPEAEARVSQT
ncbi:MAG: efflux RND transporter periplasmic adaptor subunit [Pseudomonadota bacterium]